MDRFILRAQFRAVLPNGAVLHASSVARREKALLFLAPSGGGKSTIMEKLTREAYGAIADDSAVISTGTDGVIRCLPCGSMKQGTGREDIHGAPLHRIFFVEKGSPPLIYPVSGQYAFYRTLRSSSIMAYSHLSTSEQRQARDFLQRLFLGYPAFILRYSKEHDPVQLLVGTDDE